jgi:hypothetical protein
MQEEGLPFCLMGNKAVMKMTHLLCGIDMEQCSPQNLHIICFKVGAPVILHKLKAKHQLNGIHGTGVHPFH